MSPLCWRPFGGRTSNLGRFEAAHFRWMSDNALTPDQIPLRVVLDGLWPTEEEYVQSMRKTRMELLTFIAATDEVVHRLRIGPLRDGGPQGSIDTVTMADGKILTFIGRPNGAPVGGFKPATATP